MKLKKLLSVFLALAMLLGVCSVPVFADGNVAKIGTVEYASLAEAVAAAQAGDTVTLLTNVTLSETLEISKSITLDLNENTLSKSLASASDKTPVIKALAGTVEIKNGKITYDISTYTGTGATSNANVINVGMNMSNGIYSGGECDLTLKGVDVSVIFPKGKSLLSMIYVESGKLNVIDSDLSATNVSGNTSTQHLIYTKAHNSAKVNPYVSISGSTTLDTNSSAGIHAIWLQDSDDTLIISGNDVTISADATWKLNSYSTNYGYAVNNQNGAACTIEGGKFLGKVWQTKGTIDVSGGYFGYDQGTLGQKNKITLAEGLEYRENTDPATMGTYPYVVAAPVSYVAMIGETGYETLAEAIAAVPANGTVTTITMIADYEAPMDHTDSSSGGYNVVSVAKDQNVILDLNGKTITGVIAYDAKNSAVITVSEYGTLTVRDTSAAQTGTITHVKYDDGVRVGNWAAQNWQTDILFNHGGTLTVESGTIANTANGNICYAIDTSNNYRHNNATLTITGGTITSQYCDTIRMRLDAPQYGEDSSRNVINVSGGTISGRGGIWAQVASGTAPKGRLTITGGTITGGDWGTLSYSAGSGVSIDDFPASITGGRIAGSVELPQTGYISGGKFSQEPEATRIAEGYEAVAISEDPYFFQVVPVAAKVARIGSNDYESLADAIAAATAGQTVTLLANVDLTDTQIITKNLTIDLNGQNITATDARALWVKSGEVTITGEGTVSASGAGLGSSSSVIRVGDSAANNAKAKLIVDANVTVSSDKCYGISVFGVNDTDNEKTTADIELEVYGTVAVTGTASAISGNGTSTLSATTMKICGTVSATQDYAIYHPGKGELYVYGTVTGLGGIEAKGGNIYIGSTELNISGVSITATAPTQTHSAYNNGASTSGYAIAAVSNAGYAGQPVVTIDGNVAITGQVIYIADNDAANNGVVQVLNSTTGNISIPADYEWEQLGASCYVLKEVEVNYVAQIGDAKYESLADAIAAVPTDGTVTTITMIANEELTSGVTVAAGKNIVLELNGKTISGNSDAAATYAVITNRGTLTIQDSTDVNANGQGTGKITALVTTPDQGEIPGYASNVITNNGVLTINSGLIENTTLNGYAAYTVDNQTNGNGYTPVFTMNGGRLYNKYTDAVRLFLNSDTKLNKVVINGGILDSDKASGRVIVFQNSNAKLNKGELDITGGSINGSISAWSGANNTYQFTDEQYSVIAINISGGYIYKLDFSEYMTNATLRADALQVTGGKYKVDPSAYVSTGYEAVDINEVVNEITYIKQVGKVIAGTDLTPAATPNTGYNATYEVKKQVVDADEKPIEGGDGTTRAVDVKVVTEDAAVASENTADEILANLKMDEVLGTVVASVEDTGTDISVEIQIVRDNPEIDNNTITYEVHPEAIITVNAVASAPVRISNDALEANALFTITLPVPNALAELVLAGNGNVKVTHTSTGYNASVMSYPLKGEADNYYVQFNVSHFSEFELAVDNDQLVDPFAHSGKSLVLEDKIGIIYHVGDLKDRHGNVEADPSRFTVKYTFQGVTKTVALTSAVYNKIELVWVAAKEMTDVVSIELYYDGALLRADSYSVQQYCHHKIAEEPNTKLDTLCRAILDYGAAAQVRFEHNLSDLANATYSLPEQDRAIEIPNEFGSVKSGDSGIVNQIGASLSLVANTEINFYFQTASGFTAQDYTATVNGGEAKIQGTGSIGRIVVPGTAAKNLNVKATLVLTRSDDTSKSYTYQYAPMTWAYNKQTNATEHDVCLALYNYYLAAASYFASSN